jgi:hypothetical protein
MAAKQAPEKAKTFVKIFVGQSTTSKNLFSEIDKILTDLNKHNVIIKFIKVTSENAKTITKQQNITRVPTLVDGNIHRVGVASIVDYLTSKMKKRETFGKGILSPEEQVNKYMQREMDSHDDEESNGETLNGDTIRKRMADMQKKRPEMAGMPEKSKISGGKPLQINKKPQPKFSADGDGDLEFVKQAGKANVVQTPTQKYDSEDSGNLILEEYYRDEAFKCGKTVGKGKRR